MSRRGESIFKRKDGRWEARYPYGKDEEGKTRYRSVYGKTYKEVKSKKEQLLQVRTGDVKSKTNDNLTMKDILFLWLEWKRVALKIQTIIKYRNCIEKHIIPELGEYKLSAINATVINRFLFKKSESGKLDQSGGLSNNYLRLISIIVNSALQYAVNENYIDNFKGQVFKPKVEKKEIEILKKAEQEQLEHYIRTDCIGTNLGIYLALHTGIRIGELCALQWSDVDFDEKVLYVRKSVIRLNQNKKSVYQIGDTKTVSSVRTIPITDYMLQILDKAKNNSKSSFIISDHTHRDAFVNPRTLEYRYKSVLSSCGIPLVKFHTLRHTFATRCIEYGVDIKSLSEILGHANVTITLEYYVHSNMDLKRLALSKLEGDYGQ